MTIAYRRLVVNGVSIAYREAGKSSNPALVLLHGFPSSSHMFRNLLPLLAGTFRVIAPDYPGSGYSDAPERSGFSYTFDHVAEFVRQFIAQLEIERFALYVQDFGGR
jgi:pimeloyl-ACP methyl ester carboxylesterase